MKRTLLFLVILASFLPAMAERSIENVLDDIIAKREVSQTDYRFAIEYTNEYLDAAIRAAENLPANPTMEQLQFAGDGMEAGYPHYQKALRAIYIINKKNLNGANQQLLDQTATKMTKLFKLMK